MPPKTQKVDFTNIRNTNVPIALVTAVHDKVVFPSDTLTLKEQIGDNLVHDSEINGGHQIFMFAEDMEWFEEIVNVVKKHNE